VNGFVPPNFPSGADNASPRRLGAPAELSREPARVDESECENAPWQYDMVESRKGAVAFHLVSPRFPSPLIKPDVRVSRIRLSD